MLTDTDGFLGCLILGADLPYDQLNIFNGVERIPANCSSARRLYAGTRVRDCLFHRVSARRSQSPLGHCDGPERLISDYVHDHNYDPVFLSYAIFFAP